MTYKFAQLKQNVDIVEIVERFVPLRKKGAEYVGVCPFHNDKSPSLHVNRAKQVFYCPVCDDKRGDVVDFLLAYGYTHKAVAEELHGGPLDLPAPVKRETIKRSHTKPVVWTQLLPDAESPAPTFFHYRHKDASKHWRYVDVNNNITGYICRFDTPQGKEVLPYIYAKNPETGVTDWRWQSFPQPRPLYNLHDIVNNDKVIVVEGEKTADAVAALIKTHAVTCWQGGTNAVNLTDWSVLKGKTLILWPDNDYVGRKAMRHIADLLSGDVPVLKYVYNPEDLPQAWDAADRDWTEKELRDFIRVNMHSEQWPEEEDPKKKKPEDIGPPPFDEGSQRQPAAPTVPEPTATEPPPDRPKRDDHTDNSYFRVLGFETDESGPVFVFFNKRLNCIQRASAAQLTDNFFGVLAPPTFYALAFGVDAKKPEWVQWVIEVCGARKMFDESHIRGRGAWFDEGRAVLHCGDHLVVDGEDVALGDFKTKYIYEVGHAMDFHQCTPLQTSEGVKLLKALRCLGWERAVNADLLAGWCIVAPICGALDWRPHIWITGPAGTGKSWIFENIVSRLLGNVALRVQGETTEAGIRQSLGHDARPVVYDEAEGEDKRGQDRLQTILTLMRGASTADGGLTVKGSAGGSAKTYQIRSCFGFASIGVPISQQSDRSRLTMLSLRAEKSMSTDAFEKFSKHYIETFTDEYLDALRTRTIQMIPTIKKNAKVFAKACSVTLGSQRSGDQAGILLAGAYALEADDLISYEDALKRVATHDWSEERGLEGTRDEVRLFALLMEQNIKLDGSVTRTVGELVMIAREFKADTIITANSAEDHLRRFGFRTEENYLLISNTADQIKRALKDTAWSKEHHRILERIEGAVVRPTTRFAATSGRAVAVPIELIRPEDWRPINAFPF